MTPESTAQDALMTLDDVAAHLAVDRRFVRLLTARGQLPCVRIGPKTPRYQRSDVEALIERGYEGEPSGD